MRRLDIAARILKHQIVGLRIEDVRHKHLCGTIGVVRRLRADTRVRDHERETPCDDRLFQDAIARLVLLVMIIAIDFLEQRATPRNVVRDPLRQLRVLDIR